jgi:predicted TPR repeat methyltransferase
MRRFRRNRLAVVMTTTPLFASSGDLIADRRYEQARDLAASGDLPAAAELMEQALELAPGFASAWFALGEIRLQAGDRAAAIAAFDRALAADPADRHGAGLHLARLGARPDAPMSTSYVRHLFDQYAPRFDEALTAGLAYRGPQLLHERIAALRGPGMRFASMLDLGCGTGLAAAAFRAHCDVIAGVDLSANMVEVARRKGLYDELFVTDMTEWLAGQPDNSADLIIAADAFVYLADLAPICRAAARALTPDGLFAFTVETHGGAGVVLGEKLRYAHGGEHVRAVLVAAGLVPLILDSASTRTEDNAPVSGLMIVAGPAHSSLIPRTSERSERRSGVQE